MIGRVVSQFVEFEKGRVFGEFVAGGKFSMVLLKALAEGDTVNKNRVMIVQVNE